MNVLLLTPDEDTKVYFEKEVDFKRLPAVGEYFVLEAKGCLYKTELVIHNLFQDGNFEAKIWAKPVASIEVSKPILVVLNPPPTIAEVQKDFNIQFGNQ